MVTLGHNELIVSKVLILKGLCSDSFKITELFKAAKATTFSFTNEHEAVDIITVNDQSKYRFSTVNSLPIYCYVSDVTFLVPKPKRSGITRSTA